MCPTGLRRMLIAAAYRGREVGIPAARGWKANDRHPRREHVLRHSPQDPGRHSLVPLPDRLETLLIAVLKLLASQAAMSRENTRLYRDLGKREARIRRLVDANIV